MTTKRNHCVFVAAFALTCFSTRALIAQEPTLEAIEAVDGRGMTTEVIGAEPVDTSIWPATFVFVYKNSLGMAVSRCSATVIGKRTVLTAAHCIKNGGAAKVNLQGGAVKVECTHHPDYDEDYSKDFALCKSTDRAFSGFKLETINVNEDRPRKGDEIYLLGFGCVESGGVDKSFGVLYGGDATVTKEGSYTRTKGGAAVCYGDSGGGAHVVIDDNRVLFGVNSRGDISEYSSLATTASPDFLKFLDKWTSDNNLPPSCGRGGELEAGVCHPGI